MSENKSGADRELEQVRDFLFSTAGSWTLRIILGLAVLIAVWMVFR